MEEQHESALSYKSGYEDGWHGAVRFLKLRIILALKNDQPFDKLKQIIADILEEEEEK